MRGKNVPLMNQMNDSFINNEKKNKKYKNNNGYC